MAAVNQRVLNWLYSVLTGQYQDVDRTYNDTAQALSYYSSLSPKTEVYTYENGTSALLLQLSGTLPVSFRGATYRFPVTIWVPQQYPRFEPMIYVTPTASDGLMIRAGQHVDPQGRVYHPYLARWADHSDKSNILDFLAILRDVFAKEPPVVSRSQPLSLPQPRSIPPPVPPLPPDMTRPTAAPSAHSTDPQPPPPPPKTHAAQPPQAHSQPPSRTDTGHPLPPLPPSPATSTRGGNAPPYPPQQQFAGVHNQHVPARQSSLRYESAPPLPPQPQQHQRQPSQQDYRGPPPLPSQQNYVPSQPSHHRAGSYGQPQAMQPPYPGHTPQGAWPQHQQHQQHQQQQQYPPHQQYQQPPQPQQQPKPKAPIPDLLDDSPALTPPPSLNLPVPPVPRNPEKDALLHTIAQKLYEIRQAEAAKHATTLQSLAAQRDALNNALHNLQQESSQLSALQATLNSNTAALNQSLSAADRLMKSVPSLTPPSIDDLLVAPTVVANQLYDLVAEEKALGDAIFNLGRAVEKGRIEPQVFVKMVRGLGRELFTKKMLIRMCARGMGLDDGRESGH